MCIWNFNNQNYAIFVACPVRNKLGNTLANCQSFFLCKTSSQRLLNDKTNSSLLQSGKFKWCFTSTANSSSSKSLMIGSAPLTYLMVKPGYLKIKENINSMIQFLTFNQCTCIAILYVKQAFKFDHESKLICSANLPLDAVTFNKGLHLRVRT